MGCMKTVLCILVMLVGRIWGTCLGYRGKGLEAIIWGKLAGIVVLAGALGLFLWLQGAVSGAIVRVLPIGLLISTVFSILQLNKV